MDPAVMNQAKFYFNYKHTSTRLYASFRSLWQTWPQGSKELYKFSKISRKWLGTQYRPAPRSRETITYFHESVERQG